MNETYNLRGLYFHSLNENQEVIWQGQILMPINSDYYMVRLYDWIVGCPSNLRVVSLASMVNWRFYESIEEMRDAYRLGAVA